MLELSELKLPVDHGDGALAPAAARAMGVGENQVLSVTVYRRAIDARHGRVTFNYTLHVAVTDEEEALRKHVAAECKLTRLVERRYAGLDGVVVRERAPDLRPWGRGRAGCSVRCCWRGMGGSRWCWSAERRRGRGRGM